MFVVPVREIRTHHRIVHCSVVLVTQKITEPVCYETDEEDDEQMMNLEIRTSNQLCGREDHQNKYERDDGSTHTRNRRQQLHYRIQSSFTYRVERGMVSHILVQLR